MLEVIDRIQRQVQRLKWNADQVKALIASRFGGRRRVELEDGELVALLYYLQSEV
ncbi:MAG: hypothetical protein ICV55_01460 [Coleofasciculus sp. C3-bin4]|nr:hypothetical protein [Coleofasciculus sp. C3-bin4]